MVTVGLHYDVLPGREEAFEGRFAAIRKALESSTGHRSSVLYREVDRPSSYLIYSEWDSRDAFQAFIRSEAFRATTAWGREEILSGQPRHTIYEVRTPQ